LESSKLYLYIDPGTGSMLLIAIMGILSSLRFFLKKIWMKIKNRTGVLDESEKDKKKDVIIFSEGRQYADVFLKIVRLLDESNLTVSYWSIDEEDNILSEKLSNVKTEYIGNGNKAFARLNSMRADICLATTPGLEVYQWKRSPEVREYVHIFHSIDEGLAYRMFGIDFYDTILGVGEFQKEYIRRIEKLRGIKEKKFEVAGCTYMDVLVEKKSAAAKADNNPMKTILLAPSWGDSSVLNKYGEKMIEGLLATGYHLIVRPHPQSLVVEKNMIDGLVERYKNNEQVEWDFSKSNFESLSKADVLISDFSSVVFDFAFVFDKPVIYTDVTTDVSAYDEAWLEGETIWRYKIVDEIGTMVGEKDLKNIKNIIDELTEQKNIEERRNKFKNQTWANQGKAAEMVVKYLKENCLNEE